MGACRLTECGCACAQRFCVAPRGIECPLCWCIAPMLAREEVHRVQLPRVHPDSHACSWHLPDASVRQCVRCTPSITSTWPWLTYHAACTYPVDSFLKKDTTLHDFLSVQDAKEWENIKKVRRLPLLAHIVVRTSPSPLVCGQASASTTVENEGRTRWHDVITRYELPPDHERYPFAALRCVDADRTSHCSLHNPACCWT